jgi:hypothetical protein
LTRSTRVLKQVPEHTLKLTFSQKRSFLIPVLIHVNRVSSSRSIDAPPHRESFNVDVASSTWVSSSKCLRKRTDTPSRSPILRLCQKAHILAFSRLETRRSLKSCLNKLPTGFPLQDYLALAQQIVARYEATDTASHKNMTLEDLDAFMQQLTDVNIVGDARDAMEGGTSNTHWGRK